MIKSSIQKKWMIISTTEVIIMYVIIVTMQSGYVAGVYGPFDDPITAANELKARGCVPIENTQEMQFMKGPQKFHIEDVVQFP